MTTAQKPDGLALCVYAAGLLSLPKSVEYGVVEYLERLSDLGRLEGVLTEISALDLVRKIARIYS